MDLIQDVVWTSYLAQDRDRWRDLVIKPLVLGNAEKFFGRCTTADL
jgi:hypothetical protein